MSGATSGAPPKSAERVQLEHALEDLSRLLHVQEKRLFREEDEYLRTSMARNNDSHVPQFGSLVSGWEGILEGAKVDTTRGKEKIYSRAWPALEEGAPKRHLDCA
jgi:hypothetical protein